MKIYQVGGAVRDRLLGLPVHDHDWVVVGASVAQMLSQGYLPVGKDFPVFLHPKTHEEYALARTERKSGHGYGGFEFHTDPDVTLPQDLLRRDLSINAIAADDLGNLTDPYGGQRDLQDRLLRHVSPAFAEDPLRVLRVARFLARFYPLGFSIDPATLALMSQLSQSGELQALSAERVWKETERALTEANPEQYFMTLEQCGALEQLMPELAAALPDASHSDSGLAALIAATAISTQAQVRWSVLCHHIKDETSLQALQQRLKTPRHYQDTALLLWRHQPLFAEPLSAASVMALYQGLDLQRRPERLAPFIEGCQALSGLSGLSAEPFLATTAQLQQLLDALRQIQPRTLVDEGFKGAELGQELQRRQLATLEQRLLHPSP
ncbi:MAG: tRNA nucleotidyltransferase (CCA-adding enzyme) [Motiliproteus sp.]|jgi:tRNA nucleotidyltransferase (CCA-adding enzyme)